MSFEEPQQVAPRIGHPTAYVRHFRELVDLAVTHQAALFSCAEIETLRSFISLDEPCQCVFSRMIMRQGPWLRVDKLQNCFPMHLLRPEGSCCSADTFDSVDNLKECYPIDPMSLLTTSLCTLEQQWRHLMVLSTAMCWRDGWGAMAACLTVEEIKEVYNKLTLKKAKGNRSSVLNSIYSHMTKSKDLFGRPLPLIGTIHAVLGAKVTSIAVGGQAGKIKNGGGQSEASRPFIVRLTPQISDLFRRAQRLVQVPSMLSVYGHGRAASVQYPLPFNAAVLTIYGKIRFYEYNINVTRPLFMDRVQFLQWEAAHELKWVFHEALAVAELVSESQREFSDENISATLSCRIRKMVAVLKEATSFFEVDGSLMFGGSSRDTATVVRFILHHAGLVGCGTDAALSTAAMGQLPFAISLCVLAVWHTYSSSSAAAACGLEHNYMAAVDAGAILASICSEIVDIFETEARRLINLTDPTSSLHSGENPCTVYWSDSQILSFVHDESQPSGSVMLYVLAIETLRSMLASSFLVHRRGKWAERLCIDLEHLGRRQEAFNSCMRALDDPHIEGGHRITMEKKKVTLASKLSAALVKWDQRAAATETRPVSCDHDVDVVDIDICNDAGKKKRAYAGKDSAERQSKRGKRAKNISDNSNSTNKHEEVSSIAPSEENGNVVTLGVIMMALHHNAASERCELLDEEVCDIGTVCKSGTPIGFAVTHFPQKSSTKDDSDEIMIVSADEYYSRSTGTPKSVSTRNIIPQFNSNKKPPKGKQKVLSTNSTNDKDDSISTTKATKEWACRICTLINGVQRGTCAVCGSTKIGLSTPRSSASLKVVQSFERTKDREEYGKVSSGYFCKISIDFPPAGTSPTAPQLSECYEHQEQENNISDSVVLVSPTRRITDNASSKLHLPVLSELWADVVTPPKGWRPDVLELTGRRLGSKRRGKNLLLGLNGDAVSVEDLVLQMLNDDHRDDDECLFTCSTGGSTSYGVRNCDGLPPPYTGGCWQGWHCEGSPLRSLFGLLMWDILFLDSVENVFYTPYQDQPLDLQYGAVFYSHREKDITARFEWLLTSHMSVILEDMSRVYRKNFKCRCVSLSWTHPLHILQAIALGMRNEGLVAICKLMTSNFRHFQGGAPDLLVIRAYRARSRSECFVGNDVKQFEFADMNLWLGAGWERLGRPRAPKGSWPWRKGKSGLQEEEWNNLEGPVVYQDAGPDEFEDIQSSTKPSSSWVTIGEKTASDSAEEDTGDEECALRKLEEEGASEEVVHLAPKVRKQFIYSGPDLCDPSSIKQASSPVGANSDVSCISSYDWVDHWTFECMFIEVKGPTDHLADRQAVWIHALDRAGLGYAGGPRALVCQIREGRNGQESGHHQTVSLDEEI